MSGRWVARRPRLLLLFLAICFAGFSAFGATDEDALQELWKQHLAAPDDHEGVIKACQDFAASHASDGSLPFVHGLQIWHWLRAGNRKGALQQMAADLTATANPMNDGARRLAQGWISRVDREQVATALQAYYRKQIAYPKSLDQLPAEGRPVMNDRFGKPWNYKLTGFAKLAGFTDQKYSLQSAVLGDVSDFKEALALPYAARIIANPVQVMPAPGNTQAVKFNVAGNAAVVGVGQAAGDLHLAYVGTHIIIVCDYTHWKILPRP